MRKELPSLLFLLLLVIACGLSSVSAYSGTEEPKSSVMITEYYVSPEVLMQNDVGTVTVRVKNMELVKSVTIKRAQLLTKYLKMLSDAYFNVGSLGPGESLNLSFTVKATSPDGVYYPKVIIEAENAQNIRYSFPVIVDSSSLTIAVTDVPEDMVKGERAILELEIGNPRPNTVSAVKIVTREKEVIPSEVFIGALLPDESARASFTYTPVTTGTHVLNFTLEFKNGDNVHSTALSYPLEVTESKKSPELILTGIEVESMPGMSGYKITGDINNAGLEEAKSVVMKVGAADGVEAINPYKAYFIGLLSPDDFSSFELDVKVKEDGLQVPLLIEYKDEDGSLFSKTEYISIESHQGASEPGNMPVWMIGALVAITLVISGLIAYSWKKR
jgi:hypothetical protein